MNESQRPSRIGRPIRRLRRWSRHTPNGEIALMMLSVGVALVFVAVVIGVVLL